jgi:hypothetical protein
MVEKTYNLKVTKDDLIFIRAKSEDCDTNNETYDKSIVLLSKKANKILSTL